MTYTVPIGFTKGTAWKRYTFGDRPNVTNELDLGR